MKPLPFKIPHAEKESLRIEHDRMPHFYSTLHIHEEIQLTLILEGSGTAYIGDRVDQFDRGNIYLIGSNLPHVFRDEGHHEFGMVESLSVFFVANFLGQEFLELPESRNIKILLEKADHGIKLAEALAREIKHRMIDLVEFSGIQQLMTLTMILEKIAISRGNEALASLGYKPRRALDNEKLNNIFDFLISNYNQPINLSQVAAMANMSPTAFCRYFKSHTRKTYCRFLNEIRVGKACKMLIDQNVSISTICYRCGFNNISNFNRQFKSITGYTPSRYVKKLVMDPNSAT